MLVMFGYILLTPMGISFALKRLKRPEAVTTQGQVPPSLVRFALEGIRVQDVLDRSRSHPEKSLSVKAFAETWLFPEQHDYVVVDHCKLARIASLSMLRYLLRSEWEQTSLSRVMRQNTPNAYADELVEDALQRMIEESLTVLPVVDRKNRGVDRFNLQPRSVGNGRANRPGPRNLGHYISVPGTAAGAPGHGKNPDADE